jgi:serine protease Do
MKKSILKPLLFLIGVFVIVSLACGTTPEATQEVEVVDTPTLPDVVPPSGAVTSLEDVQGAVVQIQAEGTFVDPEICQ